MHPVIGSCPVCGGALAVTRLHCGACDTTIEGRFTVTWLDRLKPEQLAFAETFIRCEGKLNRMEKEMGLSYPTLRSRLNELIRAMGYEVGQDEPAPTGMTEEERSKVLDDLAAGRVTSEEAMKLLQGG
ncbi:MAG: DUF2089 domain-containing protein [Chloroflexi bacterium]|nr:DUF2089 domain-containing protein [Chloroflexota bacterium]MBI4316782.1 DUF2089 domain-containing protein [Chloroflexota bacterium]MBI5293447.1 DUF2089 domain-containing protein [Chloroflexota bacterium]